ncbi:hypothetical protein NDU88_000908 [Pleurodeles waltl]|uniref:Uncharacterized protein n=1 Tax=Pleurodeles waltl TaxID=8319 RepID=A0AAV7S982_PLEWA|nr:hypothetical protein NDU88_000908 [Pleurodeles waltl]
MPPKSSSIPNAHGSPVPQCARGSPRFYLSGNPTIAHPRGRGPPSASSVSWPFCLAGLVLSSGFLSPGSPLGTHGSRVDPVRGHPVPTPDSAEPATPQPAHQCLQGSARSRYPSLTPLLRCVPGPRGPPQVKQLRSLSPGHAPTSRSLRTATLSLVALLRPQSFLGGPHPWPGLAPLRLPTECVFHRVTRTQTASLPQLVVSAGVLHYLQPLGLLSPQPCPWPQPRSRACPCVLLGPPASSGAVSVRLSSARSPLGPPGPTGSSAATGEPARHLPLFCAVHTLTASVRGTTQGLRAASTCSPVHGCDPGLGPAPCVLLGPPASSDTASVRLSSARSHLGPQAPAGTSAATGEPARRLPLLCAVHALTTSIRGTTQGRGLCCVLRPTDSEVPDWQIPALPELPRRPTHARPPPLVLPRSLDLNRPGEGSLPTLYSPAPPELTIQACAISRSLATPLQTPW